MSPFLIIGFSYGVTGYFNFYLGFEIRLLNSLVNLCHQVFNRHVVLAGELPDRLVFTPSPIAIIAVKTKNFLCCRVFIQDIANTIVFVKHFT